MTAQPDIRTLSFTSRLLSIVWTDGGKGEFTSLWLADNDPKDRDPYSGQRLIDITDLPDDPRIRGAALRDGRVVIEWLDGLRTTRFDPAWLAQHGATRTTASVRPVVLWLEAAARDARRDCAWLALARLRDDRARAAAWMSRLRLEGIAFLSAVAAVEGAILDAAALIGRVADTNYGRLFDVRSVAMPANLAYSDRGLGLHTDNPYRDPVPGFQVLHCILASAEGGDSMFADGFALAEHLRSTDPETFEILTRTPVPFQYCARDVELRSEKPLIQLGVRGDVVAVHYNNRSIAPMQLPTSDLTRFYAAYRRFAGLLRDDRFQMQARLAAGDLVVFDNQRTLHGRTAFAAQRHPRHLQGCYLTRDSVLSNAALLNREHPGENAA
jgi:alpha-ketoglutarate-dependent taurine dioxygenase